MFLAASWLDGQKVCINRRRGDIHRIIPVNRQISKRATVAIRLAAMFSCISR